MRFALSLALMPMLLLAAIFFTPPVTVYRSTAPDGRSHVRVQAANCFVDCELRIVARGPQGAVELDRAQDCILTFAHVTWSGPVVAIYTTSAFCGNVRVAYDFDRNGYVDWDDASHWLADSIAAEYHLSPSDLAPYNGDVFALLDRLNEDALQPWKNPGIFARRLHRYIHRYPPPNSDPNLPLALP